jgi:hypothetical protein
MVLGPASDITLLCSVLRYSYSETMATKPSIYYITIRSTIYTIFRLIVLVSLILMAVYQPHAVNSHKPS